MLLKYDIFDNNGNVAAHLLNERSSCMGKESNYLWPYSKNVAIAIIPITWIMAAILFSLTYRYAEWPDEASRTIVLIIALIISLLPITLVLLDFISSRHAVVDIKGLKIDFSHINLDQTDFHRKPFALPDNIGIPGEIVADSSPMQIVSTLQIATHNEIVLVDIKDGNAWWVSRLLVLSAGAVRAGFPKALVFIGNKEKINNVFLGWSEPLEIQNSILNSNEQFRNTHNDSLRIAKQVNLFGAGENELLPQVSTGFMLNETVKRYSDDSYNPDANAYAKLGEAVFEQIFMDQLANRSLESPPDWLTIGRLDQLFGHCVYRNHAVIDLNWPSEKQVSSLLDSKASYIALVRNGIYDSMLKREEADRLLIRELFMQSQKDH